MIPLWWSSSNNGVVSIVKAAAEAPNDGRQLAGIDHVIKFIQSSTRLSPVAPTAVVIHAYITEYLIV